MKRVLNLSLSITFDDMSEADRKESAIDYGCSHLELPKLADYEASDLAEPFANLKTAIDTDEFLAGSELLAAIVDCKVVSSEFVEDEQ
ncbi:hypothetical protein [Thalassospira aquimaris]|uniref:Uncharacterized protein n=1 Tax=Thalassospira aquimaris TaxID=3037796 RepID=A0ABT6GI38_9PROT|nr:hypothetical protein [Thalassospira sp. FZY0004]MDG4721741.1 hypothetical protein [Thalassospira sp. FZY0004]